jgi:hypothetical protein
LLFGKEKISKTHFISTFNEYDNVKCVLKTLQQSERTSQMRRVFKCTFHLGGDENGQTLICCNLANASTAAERPSCTPPRVKKAALTVMLLLLEILFCFPVDGKRVSERARRIQTKRALVKGKDKPISLMMVKSGCENQKEVIQLERDGATKKNSSRLVLAKYL